MFVGLQDFERVLSNCENWSHALSTIEFVVLILVDLALDKRCVYLDLLSKTASTRASSPMPEVSRNLLAIEIEAWPFYPALSMIASSASV